MSKTQPILIATTNLGKLREIQAVMHDLPAKWQSLANHPDWPEAIEDAETFAENAAIKAIYYARLSGTWALADDSGLEVDALGGQPGVHSARYAGTPSNTAANNTKLIASLANHPPENRTARFRCAIAIACGNRIIATSEGCLEGVIIDQPRGANGFGYDPHFLIPELGKTAAELSSEQKNAISHRGRALTALKPKLVELVTTLEAN
jgi:XTP/dITP diphosphohydrolase